MKKPASNLSSIACRLAEPLAVGDVRLRNRVFLAPLSGISDAPFRERAFAHGAGMVVSEMVASGELARGRDKSALRVRRSGPSPHVVQLAGREARWMAEGARIAVGEGADIVDINMGCPAKKVTGGYSGSARCFAFGNVVSKEPLLSLLFAQIESEEAVHNAEAIAEVEGVDVLFVGPADLRLDLEARGRATGLDEAIERVMMTARRAGKQAGIVTKSADDSGSMSTWVFAMFLMHPIF